MEELEGKVQELCQKLEEKDVSGKYFKKNSNLEFKEIRAGERHF